MKKSDIYDAEIERLLRAREAALEAEMARQEKYGPEPDKNGSVISWTMVFQKGGRKYFYAAVRFKDLWSTTGPNSPKNYTWDELTTWLDGAYRVKKFRVLS